MYHGRGSLLLEYHKTVEMFQKRVPFFIFSLLMIGGCNEKDTSRSLPDSMKEKQVTFTAKTHALDNNDNFSPDGKYLCYDTRGMVFNNNLANSKSVEKVEIATGKETVLWKPESVSGENAAPGVAAASFHPNENKVIFLHGPMLDEVKERGYYNIRNRTGMIVDGEGKALLTKVDMRDIAVDRPTTPGAQRGGTHRHEFSRNGKRIGFTYDDYLQSDYGRTIGYMEKNKKAPNTYSHYFAVLLKPAKKGESKPGEIEKAYDDSWVDKNGTKRAFIGKVRSENGVDYETSLFVADIPDNVDITTAYSGNKNSFPVPPKGIIIRRLTHSKSDNGIVRGSFDGKGIAYLSKDKNGIYQVFVLPTDGSDLDKDPAKLPRQITHFKEDASNIRWHPSDNWIFSISNGSVYVSYIGSENKYGTTILLTKENTKRDKLVVSPDGNMLAYNVDIKDDNSDLMVEGEIKDRFSQIFILEPDWTYISSFIAE
jgi:hypothetical protein